MAKPKPNFFIGFPVYDKGIHQKIKVLQEKIIEKTPSLEPALINISTLHVTLAVTHLASEADIKTMKDKLDNWRNEKLKLHFKDSIVLNFTGVDTFNNITAYVKIDQCQNCQKLCDISQSMNDLLCSAGFSTDKKGFTPHLTFLKLSKNYKLLKSKKTFKNDFETLKQCTEHFGRQEVSHIQLLSIDEPKDENGYYKCLHQINTTELNQDHTSSNSPVPKVKKISPDPPE